MSDYETITDMVYDLIGDHPMAIYETARVDACLATALSRYAAVIERVETRTLQLSGGGLFGLSLGGWSGDPLQSVAYLHWPAAATVPGTSGQNKILDWWYYRKADGILYVDLQVEGTTLPTLDDWILVTGVTSHAIDGFTYLGVAGTATSVARTDWSILALGAAAYAMRSQEAVYAVQSQGLNFNTAYHVGVLSELANAMLANFDRELERIAEKRLERPPWGLAERKRMRRVLNERP